MKTIQVVEFDPSAQSFRSVQWDLERLLPGEVLVEVMMCTICGSDLHTFTGRRESHGTSHLGHEIVGKICGWAGEAPVDDAGRALQEGDRVTWAMAVGCGDCFYCNRGLNQKCVSLFKYGHSSQEGKPTGGLSSHCVLVPNTTIVRLPETMPLEVACPANCATATVSAALRLVAETHRVSESSVLILGAGMLGLTASAQFAEAGATTIMMIDPNESRLELARQFDATHTIASVEGDVIRSEVSKATAEKGADIVLDFAGGIAATQACLDNVRTGGTIILAGTVFPAGDLALDVEQVVRRMITVRGLHNYRPDDLSHAIQFLGRVHDHYPFESLVSKTFSLDEVGKAFESAMVDRPVRVAVKPVRR